jgi:MFS transporter, FSR family, fosmidomycin resistance protein
MTLSVRNPNESTTTPAGSEVVLPILVAASFSHLLNDTLQSLIPAIYPVLKDSFALNFAQIGLITLTFQVTASLLQPLVGLYTDRRPQPFSLAIGMTFSLVGLVLLATANSYPMILVAAASVGLGSSIFHPEASGSHWSHWSESLCSIKRAVGTSKIFREVTSRSSAWSARLIFLRRKFYGLFLSSFA